MKYKVGDKVKIKSIEWYNENKNEGGFVVGSEEIFTNGMAELCGKVATIICVNSDNYKLDIDDTEYHWYDWMFEDTETPVKTLKIKLPEGYVIDEEKSTFQEIVFKKSETTHITWNYVHCGVEVSNKDERFVISCDVPAFYCNWNDARRYSGNCDNWNMPSVKQLKVIEQHLGEINNVIRNHCGYTICRKPVWSCEYSIFENFAKSVNMDGGLVSADLKEDLNIVFLVKNI